MSYNKCKDTHKFGNKYLPSAYKMQVDFRSHFLGEKSASYSPRNTVFESGALNAHKCRPTHYIVKYTLKYSPQTLCITGLKDTLSSQFSPENQHFLTELLFIK